MALSISFHGGVKGVTGSCHELHTVAGSVLVDCGMFQGSVETESGNAAPFSFDPSAILAVCVTHPHADHTGRLPKLVKDGFAGTIYMTPPCLALSRIVLEDTAQMMLADQKHSGVAPSFTVADVATCLDQVKTVGYHQTITLADGVTAMFHDAGHVLGSAYVSVEVEGTRVVFSGDIGNDDVPILPPTEPLSHADIVVCESTYGDRVHEDTSRRRAKLMEAIAEVVALRGTLLIPAFSVERTQELLYELDRLLLEELKTDMPIYLDSPMAIRATQAYRDFKEYLQFNAPILSEPDRDFFSFPNLRETLSVEASKAINDVPAPKIVIAGSGMMSGGRIMHHLLRALPLSSTVLLIIGYQGEGTLGRVIFNGAKEVSIYGQRVAVRAHVRAIGAFSAHGDRDKLTRWLTPEDGKTPRRIFLVHGDTNQKLAFKTHLEQTLKTAVEIPEPEQSFDI